MICPSCGFENPEGMKFCGNCAAPLSGDSSAPIAPAKPEIAPSPVPASFAAGRYRVKRFLGEGGRKRVYLAHDSKLDREVAIAAIKTEGLDHTGLVRVRREAQAMGRLGDHPHIVTVYDIGEEGDQPYIVSQYMAGGDVEGVLQQAENHRLPLEQSLRIADQVCQALEHAHARGIIHRDLKPGNVWLTQDGTAKLGDFGLAVALDRSRLTVEGMMVGTVAYMPPEQALGREADARSDLYSLGCVLYEMVTSRPPFLGDDVVAIISQHINTAPVSPSWHNPEVPRALEALIMRLLAKAPEERPESALTARKALAAISATASTVAERVVQEEANPLDRLAGGVFVGREREMDELRAGLEDALSGRGRLLMLMGEPGIGKTRTAEELATYARLRNAQVLWGRCYEGQGVPPYWPWVQAIRSYVREHDPDRLRSEMGAGAADIAEIVSDVKERLPDLEPPPKLEPEAARFRLFDSITSFLKGASQTKPLMLVLDDLHWADESSLLLLQFLARELARSRLLVVGTYRDVEISRKHPLAEVLGELTKERLFQRILLRGLKQEDVGRFIELTSGMEPPAGLVEAVYTQTEGNPLFVTEIVRLLVQEEELTDEVRKRESWTVRIPEGVREVIGRRLNRLSERSNQTLITAAVIGREFELRQLKPLIEDLTEDMLLDVLEEALEARIVEELPQAVGRYQFTHALIQETLTEELSLTRRVRLHARIAETLEKLYGDQVEAHAAELAQHFAQAESILGPEKVIKYSLAAGEKALASYAHEEAMEHFQRVLGAKGEDLIDAEAAAALFGLGRAQVATLPSYRRQDAIPNLTRAFDFYAEKGDIAQAVEVAAYHVPFRGGDLAGAAELIPRALKLVPPGSLAAGRLLSGYGSILGLSHGDYQGAQSAFGEALQIADRENNTGLKMATLTNSCVVNVWHLRLQRAAEQSLEAAELARHLDEPSAGAIAQYYRGYALYLMGDFKGAPEHWEASIEMSQRIRDSYRLAVSNAAMGRNCWSEGKVDLGRSLLEQAVETLPGEPIIVGLKVIIDCDSGDVSASAGHIEQALDVMRASPPRPSIDFAAPAMFISIDAYATGNTDRIEIAKEAAEVVLSSPTATPFMTVISRLGLALAAVVLSDAKLAREQYDALSGLEIRAIIGYSIDRIQGLLSRTMGQIDQAIGQFEEALTFYLNAGAKTEVAWVCCEYAETLLQRKGTADRKKAMSLLDQSLNTAHELGMKPLVEKALALKSKAQGIASTHLKTSIDAVAASVQAEKPDLRPHTAPDGTVTILFTDIEGSTTMTERLGDQRWLELLRAHNVIVREQVATHQGFEVKSRGDGFMLAFSSARRALQCAIDIQRAFAAYGEEHPQEPLRVRIGLNTGEALKEADDFFGKAVILAARIADKAQGRQILVSELLRNLVGSLAAAEFRDAGRKQLKGIRGRQRVYEVMWE